MKLKSFQGYLKQQDLDLVFLTSPDSNITYFTQLVPSCAHFLITPKIASLSLTKLDSKPKLKGIGIEELKKDWEKNLKNKLKGKTARKVGINNDKISYSFYLKLKKIFPGAKFIDISPKLKELRMQKTEEEIERINKACRIATNAFNELIGSYSPKQFKTEADIACFLEKKIKEQGAEPAFPVIVASGTNSSVPHHQTSNFKLRKGFLQLDFGAKYKNYCSDMSRVLFLGAGSREQRERYNLLLNVQMETIGQIKSGCEFSDLDKFARKKLGKYSSHFVHSLGHGLGIDIHEPPALSSEEKSSEEKDKVKNKQAAENKHGAGNRQIVENKQVFTIEPGIYFPGKYGLRIEDTILFDKKTKILTTAAKELVFLK